MILSITRLRLAKVTHLWKFFSLSAASVKQAVEDPACLAGATYFGPGLAAWTATVWKSEEDMIRYIRSGDHKEAMPYLARICSEAATGHFEVTQVRIPLKREIRSELLKSQPKFFRLQEPSQEHLKEEVSEKFPFTMQIFKS